MDVSKNIVIGDRSTMLTISSALETIENLSNRPLHNTGVWQPYAILTHCAQSVECSMLGYPIQQPEIYKATVGKLAFTLFSALGSMQHPLDAPFLVPQNWKNMAISKKL